MTAFPSYSTGTVSVSNGGTVVTGAGGANWSGVNAKSGDTLLVAGHEVIVVDVTDATHLVVDAWPYTTVSGGAYEIYKTSPLRFVGGDAMADVSTLVAALNTDGFYVFVDPADTVPDPSYGDENQFAFQPTTGKLWLKTGGIWVSQPALSTGTRFTYSTTTADADPGSGVFRLNNATPASATAAYIDNLDASGTTVTALLDQMDDSTNTIKGILRFQKASDPTKWVQFNVTGSVVDGTGYRKITLASGVGSGAFTNSDAFVLTFFRSGDAGTAGSTGGTGAQGFTSGIRQAYSSTTADADPGAGTFRLNNATPASATAAYLDNVDTGGVAVNSVWDTYDDSTSTVRGYIRFEKSSNPAVWAQFQVTGTVVDGTGYRKLTLANGVGSGSFSAADVFSISFARSGNSSSGDMLAANNLSDVANAATAAANLSAVRYAANQGLSSTNRANARANISAVLAGQLYGLTLSTAGSSSAFGITTGEAADSTAVDLMVLASAYTKHTGAWTVGTGNGALDTGSVSNTWYHVYLIKRPDTGVVDVLMSLSASAPTMPANYTLARRIGSLRVESGNFRKFTQTGDQFTWDVVISDYNSSALSTSAILITLTIPPGLKLVGMMRAYMSHPSTGNVVLLSSADESDQIPSGSNFNIGGTQLSNGISATQLEVVTDTSARIRARSNATSTQLGISTFGWKDTRGRLG